MKTEGDDKLPEHELLAQMSYVVIHYYFALFCVLTYVSP